MTLLREAMLKAMRRRKSDESKVDAILDLLGLDEDDGIVNMGDVSQVLAYVIDANEKLEDFGEDPEGWEAEDFDELNKSMTALHSLLPSHLVKDDDE